MGAPPTIVWFRQDLRLRDNPALDFALSRCGPIMPLYIWSPDEEGDWAPGAASRWWLHHSLVSLDDDLRRRGSRLVLQSGDSLRALRRLIRETGATAVAWNRRYEPDSVARDTRVKQALLDDGIEARSFNGSLIASPLSVRNKSDRPFRVFTPFWRFVSDLPVRRPIRLRKTTFPAPAAWPESLSVGDLAFLPRVRWDRGFFEHWQPGEAGAQAKLDRFLGTGAGHYRSRRDLPAENGTSGLSPHLHFGEVSPVQVFEALSQRGDPAETAAFWREVGWREFAQHVLFHFPHTVAEPMRPEFVKFPWREDSALLEAWQQARTGCPIVDAGMRQLWRTGWMHNRVRMISASFLVKHLLQPWQAGAAWFWDTLVDADLASNSLGWQWTAGCGADAAPYFRIFNPVAQGRKFDPRGAYVKRWVPELADVPEKLIHEPWRAPRGVLADAGVVLGETYPRPVVDHAVARDRALAAFRDMRHGA